MEKSTREDSMERALQFIVNNLWGDGFDCFRDMSFKDCHRLAIFGHSVLEGDTFENALTALVESNNNG